MSQNSPRTDAETDEKTLQGWIPPLASDAEIREALERGKAFQHFHHVMYAVASAYALLHKQEEALHYLQMAADDGFPCYPLFEHDPNLDSLRKNPGFVAFMDRQKKQWTYFHSHL